MVNIEKQTLCNWALIYPYWIYFMRERIPNNAYALNSDALFCVSLLAVAKLVNAAGLEKRWLPRVIWNWVDNNN